jgi:hypothetical protein
MQVELKGCNLHRYLYTTDLTRFIIWSFCLTFCLECDAGPPSQNKGSRENGPAEVHKPVLAQCIEEEDTEHDLRDETDPLDGHEGGVLGVCW